MTKEAIQYLSLSLSPVLIIGLGVLLLQIVRKKKK